MCVRLVFLLNALFVYDTTYEPRLITLPQYLKKKIHGTGVTNSPGFYFYALGTQVLH